MYNLSIKIKVVTSVVCCMAVSGFIIVNSLNKSYEKNIKLAAYQSLDVVRESFSNLEKNDVKMLSSTLEALMINEKFQKLFKENSRDKLADEAKPLYESLKKKYGITHWYFLNKEDNSTCFVRIHNPNLYNDKILRTTYLNSVKTKSFGVGKELGKTAFALRVVHPYYDTSKNLLGYMEVGEEIDHFIDILEKQTGNEITMVIGKKYLNKDDWASSRKANNLKNNWEDQKDIVFVGADKNDINMYSYDGNLEDVPDSGLVLDIQNKNNLVFTRGIIPIYDAKNQKVGGIFVLKNITSTYLVMLHSKNQTILVVVMALFLLCVILIYLLNKLIFVRLARTSKILTRVVGGEFETEIKIVANDEIGKFEELLELFRKLFVNTINDIKK